MANTLVMPKTSVEDTHCELDSSFLIDISCGVIPFANHDNLRRVLYQSRKHSLQAVGYSATHPSSPVNTNSHQLYYPQMPLSEPWLLIVGVCECMTPTIEWYHILSYAMASVLYWPWLSISDMPKLIIGLYTKRPLALGMTPCTVR